MKKLFRSLLPIAMLALAGSTANAAVVSFALDFQNTSGDSATATGWTAVSSGVGSLTTFSNPVVVLDSQYTLSFTGTLNSYATAGTATNPLNRDGWFVPTAEGSVTYTISGLNFGDKVTVRAIDAWDPGARGALISFGGQPAVHTALAADDPGLSPVPDDLVFIGQKTSLGETSFSGVISINVAEAQFGGFYIEIQSETIPEPSALGLVFLGLGLVATARRRFRSLSALRN